MLLLINSILFLALILFASCSNDDITITPPKDYIVENEQEILDYLSMINTQKSTHLRMFFCFCKI